MREKVSIDQLELIKPKVCAACDAEQGDDLSSSKANRIFSFLFPSF